MGCVNTNTKYTYLFVGMLSNQFYHCDISYCVTSTLAAFVVMFCCFKTPTHDCPKAAMKRCCNKHNDCI